MRPFKLSGPRKNDSNEADILSRQNGQSRRFTLKRKSQARRDHDRIHLEAEDLIHIPTLSDETLQKIQRKRDFMNEELAEVDLEMSRVVRAMREASCAKYARARNGKKA